MNEELHISSLVVHALPSKVEAVQRAIGHLDGTEIHAVTVEGRMIVTVETRNEADFLKRFAEIDRLTGVVSTALVFHQVEAVVLG
jgi:periplasmic nitrate reductase NapD